MLRAAYLAVFSVTGYRLLPRWKRIRDQIAKPAAVGDWVMRLTRHDHDLLPDRRQFVEFGGRWNWPVITLGLVGGRLSSPGATIPLCTGLRHQLGGISTRGKHTSGR
jgi:hypothetical protein